MEIAINILDHNAVSNLMSQGVEVRQNLIGNQEIENKSFVNLNAYVLSFGEWPTKYSAVFCKNIHFLPVIDVGTTKVCHWEKLIIFFSINSKNT